MPNGRDHKEFNDYGAHEYPAAPHGTSDCKYGCGCWAGPSRSGGPPGIDPFGHCPGNPLDGQRQPGNEDYEDCVNGRIQKLESELYAAKQAVDIVQQAKKGTKVELVNRLDEAEEEIVRLKRVLESVHISLSSDAEEISEVLGKSA